MGDADDAVQCGCVVEVPYPVIQLRLTRSGQSARRTVIGEMAGNTTPDHDQARFASARLNKLLPDERLPQPTTTSVTGASLWLTVESQPHLQRLPYAGRYRRC